VAIVDLAGSGWRGGDPNLANMQTEAAPSRGILGEWITPWRASGGSWHIP
jgi:hypothetical protein